MKDYTDSIINKPEVGIMVTFVLKDSGSAKLQVVKLIKDVTGLGLKDSKDFIDESNHQNVMFRRRMSMKELTSFREKLSDCSGIKYAMEDKSDIRHMKLMSMGLCDKEEVIEELSKLLLYEITESDTEELISLLGDILSYIDEDKMVDLYNKKIERNSV